MNKKAKANNLIFRPHFKTHQLGEVGNWFRDEGIEKITVSSVEMAEYFSKYDWNDITIAFPVNIREIDNINRIARESKLNLLVESTETITFLDNNLEKETDVFIKIDLGYHRTGVLWDNTYEIKTLIEEINASCKLNFSGFLMHAGNTYQAENKEEILKIYTTSLQRIEKLKFEYPKAIISYGDTPSCSLSEDFTGIDEIRPGNFVFYDFMQLKLGSCLLKDVAVVMACPVVAKHRERLELVIYGGAVHFSKDSLSDSNGSCYGLLVGKPGNEDSIAIEGKLTRLSQEHGIVKVERAFFDKINIGDLLYITPVHSCLTMDLMKHKGYKII